MLRLSFGICWLGLGIVTTAGGCNGNATKAESPPLATGGSNAVGGGIGSGGTATSVPSSGGNSSVGSGSGRSGSGGGNSGGAATLAQGGSPMGGSIVGGTSSTTASNIGGSVTGGTKSTGGTTAATNNGGTSATSTGGSPARGGAGGVAIGGSGGQSSSGQSSGGTSAGGAVATGGLWRGPTPASTSARFPFPQNRFSANCVYPTDFKNEDVQTVYSKWKADLVVSDGAGALRVRRPAEPGLEVDSTVSEGIAYGMIIAVYMNDQTLFDGLWKYAQKYPWTYVPSGGGTSVTTILMNWYITSAGKVGTATQSGDGAATDADEDMAWALIMADKQWGGLGTQTLAKSYLDYAKLLLNDIWTYEIYQSKLPKNGSGWGDWNSLNISYFAPAYYRVFAKVSGNATWGGDVVKCVYDTIEANLTAANANQTNGLVPAFSTSTGGEAWVAAGQPSLRHDYQYDSCRTPFRIGLDACLFNEPRAKTYLGKLSQFFVGKGAANITDGYALNGTPTPEYASRGYQGRSAAFIGPAGVGAMQNSSYLSFVNDVWGLVRQNNLWCGGQYYDESWTTLSMLMMSGNFLDYTVETPK
jgi:endo-1,4-beta-D-glucanase Y